MAILVVNSGSSSIKFALMNAQTHTKLLSGMVEQLNQPQARFTLVYQQTTSTQVLNKPDYKKAFEAIFSAIAEHFKLTVITAVGHRVVHGAELFSQPTVITDEVLASIKQCHPLAPLHNPANCLGIDMCRRLLPKVPQVAVFDTAFHQTLPPRAYVYALPYPLYQQHGLRRYGFHGTSHQYVAQVAAKQLDKPDGHYITAHLGNGCSVCAIKEGKSVDTSLGFTPLEGLVMGTRSGDVDPGLVLYLIQGLGYSAAQVNDLLNKQSGLLGISQLDSDMRSLTLAAQQGNKQAQLAIEIFCYRLAKYIAAMLVPLGCLDALIFTAGIGEHSAEIRAQTCAHLTGLGISLDAAANRDHGVKKKGVISAQNSLPVLVIATDEEYAIASQVYQVSETK